MGLENQNVPENLLEQLPPNASAAAARVLQQLPEICGLGPTLLPATDGLARAPQDPVPEGPKPIKDNPELVKAMAVELARKPDENPGLTVDQISVLNAQFLLGKTIEDLNKNAINGQIQKLGSKNSFDIVSKKIDGLTVNSYELTVDGQVRKLHQAIFRPNGRTVQPDKFIADQLKKPEITPEGEKLIEETLQAMYRQNAVSASAFSPNSAFGPAFVSKMLEKIQGRLDPSLELTAKRLGETSSYTFELRDKNTNKELFSKKIDLDPEQKDSQIKNTKWFAEHLSAGNPTDFVRAELESELTRAYIEGGIDRATKIKNEINVALKKLHPSSTYIIKEAMAMINEPKKHLAYDLFNTVDKSAPVVPLFDYDISGLDPMGEAAGNDNGPA